jgi:glycine dehydrogenase subunit 2
VSEPLLFEITRADQRGPRVPAAGVSSPAIEDFLPKEFRRAAPPPIPSLSEPEVARHFGRLARLNHSIHQGIYPLGSCTMKYNPTVNERVARFEGFAGLHPYHPEARSQGALQLMFELEQLLNEITGMARTSLQPAAGAHGEWTGLRMIQAYHRSRGDTERDLVLIPDSAHGTNPATASLSGMTTVTVKSGPDGAVDLADFKSKLSRRVAAVMMTTPNTLGVFEKDIVEITRAAHAEGVLLYYDGANLNALVGVARPGDMGFDVVHLNLHKTFSTPHGGGGPGAGPVGVKELLVPFLPVPTVEKRKDTYTLDYDRPQTIGKVRAFYGNFGMLVRAYAYIRAYGSDLRQVAEDAVLNSNYLRHHLEKLFDISFPTPSMHEFVLSARRAKEQHGVKALDIAKRLIDMGVYPPTIYFPMIVPEALMIEPTETESKATLDAFIESMRQIHREIEEEPDTVRNAPLKAPVGRLDEVKAARQPNLRWRPPDIKGAPAPQPAAART